MIRVLVGATALSLIAAPSLAQADQGSVQPASSQELSPGISKAVEILKSKKLGKSLFYMELVDNGADRPNLRFNAYYLRAGDDTIRSISPEDFDGALKAIQGDLGKLSEMDWRSLTIVVDDDNATVTKSATTGPPSEWNARSSEVIRRAFSD